MNKKKKGITWVAIILAIFIATLILGLTAL